MVPHSFDEGFSSWEITESLTVEKPLVEREVCLVEDEDMGFSVKSDQAALAEVRKYFKKIPKRVFNFQHSFKT